MSRQTIVIIGGSGFIGRHLAAAYQADGHRVIIVSRHPASAREADKRFEYIAALHHLAQHWTAGMGGFAAWWVDAALSVGVGSVVGLALYAATAILAKIRPAKG